MYEGVLGPPRPCSCISIALEAMHEVRSRALFEGIRVSSKIPTRIRDLIRGRYRKKRMKQLLSPLCGIYIQWSTDLVEKLVTTIKFSIKSKFYTKLNFCRDEDEEPHFVAANFSNFLLNWNFLLNRCTTVYSFKASKIKLRQWPDLLGATVAVFVTTYAVATFVGHRLSSIDVIFRTDGPTATNLKWQIKF